MSKPNSDTLIIRGFLLIILVLGGQLSLAQEHDEHGHGEDFVKFTPAELAEFNIQLADAGPGEMAIVRKLPGEVRVNEDRLAHIGPRYAGIVTDVRVKVGDVVRDGQVLAMIESDVSLAPYPMTAIRGGTIIERHLAIGEPVSRGSGGFVVADLSDVWIDITIYQHDLDRIRVGKKVLIRSGSGEHSVSGTISYLTPVVDEHTRTATARLVVSNKDGYWRPGMFVSATVTVENIRSMVVVPLTAVHSFEGRDVVFVEMHDGFVPQPVVTGQQGDDKVVIISGLESGARYVAVGGFTMKAELGKESFGDGHNH